MKNAINYFYNLAPTDIYQNKEKYYFEVDKQNYIIEECNRSLEELYELYNLEFYLYNYQIFLHQIVLNKHNEMITEINNKKYILLKVYINNKEKISIDSINRLSNIEILNKYNFIKRNNWHELWTKKIDYIEYLIEENKYKYKELSCNIDYFIGLTENAIQLFNKINNEKLYISHFRINSNMRVEDLYDPLNIVLDTKIRDICEFFKDVFFKKNNIDDELLKYIDDNINNSNDLNLLFIRLLYITKYFDIFDMFFLNNRDNMQKNINIIINQIEKYELFLRKIYYIIYQKGLIDEVEWLKKSKY